MRLRHCRNTMQNPPENTDFAKLSSACIAITCADVPCVIRMARCMPWSTTHLVLFSTSAAHWTFVLCQPAHSCLVVCVVAWHCKSFTTKLSSKLNRCVSGDGCTYQARSIRLGQGIRTRLLRHCLA